MPWRYSNADRQHQQTHYHDIGCQIVGNREVGFGRSHSEISAPIPREGVARRKGRFFILTDPPIYQGWRSPKWPLKFGD